MPWKSLKHALLFNAVGTALLGALLAAAAGGATEVLEDAAIVLYGEARILDGETPDDPAEHAERVARLIARSLD